MNGIIPFVPYYEWNFSIRDIFLAVPFFRTIIEISLYYEQYLLLILIMSTNNGKRSAARRNRSPINLPRRPFGYNANRLYAAPPSSTPRFPHPLHWLNDLIQVYVNPG